MSTILGQVTTGLHQQGVRMIIAGQEKVGKTTLASGAPHALLVPLEVGYTGISCAKTPMLQHWSHLEQFINETMQAASYGQFPFKTIVFDSGTALERHIHESVLMMDSGYAAGNKKGITMEVALGGYGRAYSFANERFDWFLKMCDILAVSYNINIIITCHVFSSKVIDPTAGEYDSWDLQLHSPKNNKTYGKREIITQWADFVGFFYEPIFVTKGDGLSKGVDAKKGRVLGLSRTPSYVAGNRFGMNGEIPIPKDGGWNAFASHLYNSSGINLYNYS